MPAIAPFLGWFRPAMDYAVDADQRSVLSGNVMRQRGNQYREHIAETVPHVREYQIEPVLSGATLERPVNYGLVRVIPPAGVVLDPTRRPVVIVDPRAGHEPGIGGFKAESEIGVAFNAGHPSRLRDGAPHTPVPWRNALPVFKAMVRKQFNILLVDTEAALEAIPSMLPRKRKNGVKHSISSGRF